MSWPRALTLLALTPSLLHAGVNVDPRLVWLTHVRARLGTHQPGDLLRGYGDVQQATAARRRLGDFATAAALQAAADPTLRGVIQFAAAPSVGLLLQLERDGIHFVDFGAGPAGSETLYPFSCAWANLPVLLTYSDIVSISPAWRVGGQHPLAQSRPQIDAPEVWDLKVSGLPVEGTGVLIADFDTGINYYHPAFFYDQGKEYNWLDTDRNGQISLGDGVDLDGDGKMGAGESLRWIEASGTDNYGNSLGFDLDFDWLYVDTDGDGSRDYGPDEPGPTYGEQLFRPLDNNSDGTLAVGEKIRALGDSKVRAIRTMDGTTYRRGSNLTRAPLDTYGHGTPVSGILAGGWRGHAMAGIAPGAELLHILDEYTFEAPFLVPIEEQLLWAQSEGADVILIEDGEWIWHYLDGSSTTEVLLDQMTEDGLLVVVPAGNLATGNMHTRFSSEAGVNIDHSGAASVMWMSFIWRGDATLSTQMALVDGSSLAVPTDGTTTSGGGLEVYGYRSRSDRGTWRQDLRISTTAGVNLSGSQGFGFSGASGVDVHGYFYDDASGWSSASSWSSVDPSYTVTWPATADSIISVAAYNPDGDGGINTFSGWGPRVDGVDNVTLAAPGSVVFSTDTFTPGQFTSFGGTSSAGPHVAGAAALLRQLKPDLDQAELKAALVGGATVDNFVQDPTRWGAGKLRVMASADLLDVEAETPTPDPDPVGCSTSPISSSSPTAAALTITLFTLWGRRRHR